MAQSLVCNDCGLQLKSVKEATDHNEATGHANFAESEEKVGTPSFRVQKLPKLPIPDKPELAHVPSPCCAGCQHGVRGVRKALQKQDAAGSAQQTHWPHQICRQGENDFSCEAFIPFRRFDEGAKCGQMCLSTNAASSACAWVQTNEAAAPMDTEAQMKQVRAEQDDAPAKSSAAEDAPLVSVYN